MPDLRFAAVAGALALAFAPAASEATSIAFGVETGAAASLQSGGEPTIPGLEELAGLGTWTPENAEGVAFWSLDAPTGIFQDGQQVARIDHWDAAFKVDPFVQNNVSVTNTSAYTQVYIVSLLMPIPAFSYDQVIFSSVGITATDSDGNNVLLVDTAGASFYRGRVNNQTLLTFDPAILPIDTADCSPNANQPGCTATTTAGIASMPVAQGVANDLQIILRFALSTGDSASITSRFEIASSQSSVPEPSTGALVAIGLIALRRARGTRDSGPLRPSP